MVPSEHKLAIEYSIMYSQAALQLSLCVKLIYM